MDTFSISSQDHKITFFHNCENLVSNQFAHYTNSMHICMHDEWMSVCMYVCMHAHACMYACMMNVWMYVWMYVCVNVWMYVWMYVCVNVCMDECMYILTIDTDWHSSRNNSNHCYICIHILVFQPIGKYVPMQQIWTRNRKLLWKMYLPGWVWGFSRKCHFTGY